MIIYPRIKEGDYFLFDEDAYKIISSSSLNQFCKREWVIVPLGSVCRLFEMKRIKKTCNWAVLFEHKTGTPHPPKVRHVLIAPGNKIGPRLYPMDEETLAMYILGDKL